MNKVIVAVVVALFCMVVLIEATTPALGDKPRRGRGGCAKKCLKGSKDEFKACIGKCIKRAGRKFAELKKRIAQEEKQEEVESDSMIGAGITLAATTSLNVRNGACTNKGIVATLAPGQTVKTTGWQGTDCGYLWYGVHGSFGYGYVAANFVRQSGGGSPSPSPAPSSGTFNCGQAYDNGRAIGEKRCVKIDGSNVVDSTATVFNRMKAAAAQQGVTLKINSGFRTQAEQQYFYNCYIHKNCNNGNLAARPGYSNHQNGIALDISVPGNVYNWLARNASKYGFIRTVSSETWHWEYRPGSRCNAIVGYSCS